MSLAIGYLLFADCFVLGAWWLTYGARILVIWVTDGAGFCGFVDEISYLLYILNISSCFLRLVVLISCEHVFFGGSLGARRAP